MADPRQDFGTILGADAKFKGEMSFESSARVLGKFEGSIKSKGLVDIADGSDCKATVTAKEVTIEGHVDGNVEAADRLEIKSTGAITGDIVAGRMTMADGASISGHCQIGVNGGGKGASTAEVKPTAQTTQTAKAAK